MRKVYIVVIILSAVLCCIFGAILLKENLFPTSKNTEKAAATADEATLEVGNCCVLPLSEEDEAKVEEWVSDNESAVTVDSGGRIDAHETGTATVCALLSDGEKRSYIVTAQKAAPAPATDTNSSAITANSEQLQKNLKDKSKRLPYEIHVNRKQNVVTVYTYDDKGTYTVPVRAMICSCGINNSTDLGTFYIYSHTEWHALVNDVFGQYASAFSDDLLFHSVPYTDLAKNTLKQSEFNKLGVPASKGCVRMASSDCKWVSDNCAPDTVIKIFDSDDIGPLGKPEMVKITDFSQGWDPTDPDPKNPYAKKTPRILGAEDVKLNVGEGFDPLEHVIVFDTCDCNITDKTEVIGHVDPNRAGTYRVTYRVTDALHRSAEATITVTVEANDP